MHTTLPICDVKDLNPPTDKEIRLRLGHVEQDRERLRLQRQRKPLHDLDRITVQGTGQQPVGELLHPRHKRRLLRPQEKGLYQLPIVSLLGGVHLDGQLPHRADILLRRDRHPKRRVGTVGMPVLRRPADILVPQDHRNDFLVGRQTEHAIRTALFAKWIWDVAHGCNYK